MTYNISYVLVTKFAIVSNSIQLEMCMKWNFSAIRFPSYFQSICKIQLNTVCISHMFIQAQLISLGKEYTSVCRECNCEYSFLLSVSLSSALSTKIIDLRLK